jgi:glyoxylase-like metal-dependent hydrolase (beta-lactamase superfamily II)
VHGKASFPLVVMHTHAHGDHVAGDGQFNGQAFTTVVGTSVAAVQAFFQLQTWPTQTGSYELGGRALSVLPIPGHEPSHVALFDPRTGWLLTGDSLYPGRLYVRDWAAYRASVSRLVDFSRTHLISRVLGTHVEMSSTPRVDYPVGTTFQPMEHPLPLGLSHLIELDTALTRLGATPTREVHDDFIISP